MPSTTHGLFKNVYWMHHGDRLRGVRWARQSSSSSSSCFNDLAQRASSKYQIYISRSLDPFRNLSIEHFLLQNTPSDSTVLFLYVNRPCVVIGRNQNPWVEVNLPLLHSNERKIRQGNGHVRTVSEPSISLVRRRSGGGTVFHDAGNVNFCVICPTAGFHRDKHAEMVAAALRRLGVSTAKVNDRHDIVMDPAMKNSGRHLGDDCNPDITAEPVRAGRFLKISGSAYKLTRARSLHHGTCLLRSPNLDLIPLVLRSPAKPYITARGVESVRSPVGNANISPGAFAEAVVRGFGELYGIQDDGLRLIFQERRLHDGKDWVGGFVEEVETCLPDIKQGMEELMVRKKQHGPLGMIICSYEHPCSLPNGPICRRPNSYFRAMRRTRARKEESTMRLFRYVRPSGGRDGLNRRNLAE